MDYRAAIAVSCWFAVAIISSVYMVVFADKLGDVFFGVFFPIGLLVLVAIVVTFYVANSSEPVRKQEARSSGETQDIMRKLDAITKEIEQIKKDLEK